MFLTTFTTVEKDVFNCGQNGCFNNYHSQFGIKVKKKKKKIQLHFSLDILTMVEWMFLTASTAVEMDVVYLIFEAGKVLSHGKRPWSQAA